MNTRGLVFPILSLFGGVLFLVFGLILADTILTQAASSGTNTNIGSFSGAQALNDLTPFIYYTVVVVGGLGAIGVGAFTGARRMRGG